VLRHSCRNDCAGDDGAASLPFFLLVAHPHLLTSALLHVEILAPCYPLLFFAVLVYIIGYNRGEGESKQVLGTLAR
jgi:hypothetical protein